MCGIAGVFHFSGNAEVQEQVLTAMRERMVHRGPDGGANWISGDGRIGLAHRRLSIVDLSEVAAQPMCNEDGTVWVTFNGEIYNHQALRPVLEEAGHKFRTDHCDTEVLVHGYEQWGIDGLVERLDGDFAFAVWDACKERLVIARDRIGVKPVYFSPRRGAMIFASEIKAILAHPSVEADIDPIAMYHYLSFLTTPAPLTMFKGIFKLPAGHYLEISNQGELRARRYWDAVPGQGIDPSEMRGLTDKAREDFYVSGIRSRLRDSIEKRMMSDVPFGVFLSGGVDSSTNVALMSEFAEGPVNTFSVGFKDHKHLNELNYAETIAKRFRTNHHEILIDEGDMVGYLSELIHHQDEPLADWVCIPLYFVSRLTRDSGVTVVQVGEGSDEQFSGYASYMGYLRLYHRYWTPFRLFLPKMAQRGIAALFGLAASAKPSLDVYADIVDRAARDREHFWSGATVFWDRLKRQLVHSENVVRDSDPHSAVIESGLMPESYLEPETFNVIRSFLEPFDQSFPGRDPLTRMIYNEFKLRLPELLLMRVDKITMSTSVEGRVPYLDHELVQFTMDIPERWKIKDGEPKYLLKKAVEGLIPDDIIYRKKMGFGAPMSQWLRGEFGKQAEQTILGSGLMTRGYFNIGYIQKLIGDHRSGKRDNSLYIWTLFNLTAWYDYWIEGREGGRMHAAA